MFKGESVRVVRFCDCGFLFQKLKNKQDVLVIFIKFHVMISIP